MQVDENMIEVIAQAAATKLTPQEAHALGVSLVIRFGRGCEEARSYATHVNATREKLGLPRITQAVAGNPSAEERLALFRSATEKLDDVAIAALAMAHSKNLADLDAIAKDYHASRKGRKFTLGFEVALDSGRWDVSYHEPVDFELGGLPFQYRVVPLVRCSTEDCFSSNQILTHP